MLTRVTISGADDAVDPQALVSLSHQYPFVEWGILCSASRAGSPRYPSREWMIRLENTVKEEFHRGYEMHLSSHFCGDVARAAMADRLHDFPVIERVQRIQINGYTPPCPRR